MRLAAQRYEMAEEIFVMPNVSFVSLAQALQDDVVGILHLLRLALAHLAQTLNFIALMFVYHSSH
jgi:hypothetical protein